MTHADSAPTDWLTAHAALLPASGDALDIACGRGRHALWLADQGLRVTAAAVEAALQTLAPVPRPTPTTTPTGN